MTHWAAKISGQGELAGEAMTHLGRDALRHGSAQHQTTLIHVATKFHRVPLARRRRRTLPPPSPSLRSLFFSIVLHCIIHNAKRRSATKLIPLHGTALSGLLRLAVCCVMKVRVSVLSNGACCRRYC